MKIIKTKIADCVIVEPTKFGDQRGYFFESFNERRFNELMHSNIHFVQDNQSFSTRGVLRGLHAQAGDSAQAKLVRVLKGEVIDIAVDVRANSKTFGEHVAVKLSAENNLQLFVPRGFLHGFIVLSDTAEFFYKCDNYYDKNSEYGVRFDDKTLNINWVLNSEEMIVSDKDLILPSFEKFINSINK